MRPVLTTIFLFSIGLSFGQDFSYPTITSKGHNLNDFVPNGWTIIDSAKGDLNKDGIADAVVILQHLDSVTLIKLGDTVITQPRILLVLFKTYSDKLFHLIERSNTFISSHDNSIMDDPYQGLTIEKGILKIDFRLFYNAGGWYTSSSTYKFRYDNRKFALIGADLFTIHRATLEYEDYSYNFLTNKKRYTKGNDQTGTKKTTFKRLAFIKPMTFKTFIEPYSWEIENDIYL